MIRVCALGIEPASPATSGSRLRINGLYQHLGEVFDTRYVGAFHWRGESLRRIKHNDRFNELTVPFSREHFQALENLNDRFSGFSLIDETFPRFGHLSADFTLHSVRMLEQADVVIFSHPWAYAVAGGAIDHARQLVIYDAHNVELVLRSKLLEGSPLKLELVAEVEQLERELCKHADWVTACSSEDKQQLIALYDLDAKIIEVVPNGVFPHQPVVVPSQGIVASVAQATSNSEHSAVFIGGNFQPNREAVEFIVQSLAPHCPDITFIVVGGVDDCFKNQVDTGALPENVLMTGSVSEEDKNWLLSMADLGLNPMFSGSGSNIKMFDYFAAGIAVVSTPFGARGVDDDDAFMRVEADDFLSSIHALIEDKERRITFGKLARSLTMDRYHWKNISRRFGEGIALRWREKSLSCKDRGRQRPLFSVTIPTLNRPEKLRRILDLLVMQSERDFEVIIVDQSDKPFDTSQYSALLNVTVLHSRQKGACRARNRAVSAAQGKYLVFTDDDCEPCKNWLKEARVRLQVNGVVGLEGRTISDRQQEPEWRSVHNFGAESLGFMTCNLFCTAEAFETIGGFDTRFDLHDFRYDTDFGWRLQALGVVPFSEHAWVYHPPWSRSIARESLEIRNRMFKADALLMQKHPERYQQLFEMEGHGSSPGFWSPFLAGVEQYGASLPKYIRTAQAECAESQSIPGTRKCNENRIAYAFYATSDSYAIAVLIAARRLMRFSNREDIDYIVFIHDVSDVILAKLRQTGLEVKACTPIPIPGDDYYRHCLTKLRIFQLNAYDRVVYIDADSLPLQSLDQLFDLPSETHVAAPRAYWLEKPWVTSMLIVVTPTPELWERVANHFDTARASPYYDMELLNYEFGEELIFLEDKYGCLNTEWADTAAQNHFGDSKDLFQSIPLVHFSVIGKPWEYSVEEISSLLPNADPIFLEIWKTWREERRALLFENVN